ncbi:hypothetical protein [Fodinicola feengrottensis]|uniref:hypothetical protein n=1 Tax=Fodinicola feengrottensis TaxID=435914 RepID=UPI0013D3FD90|nr:hypothetical protein [Fodinicola feengrottensis]
MAYVVGALLIGVGLAHGVVWLIVGGSAVGPLSIRKPTTFGISFGITVIGLTWVSQFLALGQRTRRITLTVLAATCALEVFWVSLQHARGVMSHFNNATPLDSDMFKAAGATIACTVVVIAFFAFRAYATCTAPPAMALAIRIGVSILLVSMAAGVWMIVRGSAFDLDPDTVGSAGSIKLVHAVGMHAVQILPALAWVSSFGSSSERTRRNLVAVAGGGYALMVGLLAVLALLGTAFTAAGFVGAAAEVVAVGCLIFAWTAAIISLRRHRVAVPLRS